MQFLRKTLSGVLCMALLLGISMVAPLRPLPSAAAAAAWFDNAWLFRTTVTVNNPNATPLSNFQVQVTLNSTNFAFAEAIPNGADLRFTNSVGTLLPYWIESYDQDAQTGKIWVKVDSLPASSDTTLYLYYGNSLADKGSDGNQTFSFFDDFSDYDISDWTKNFVNLGVSSEIHFYDGKVGLNVGSIDYGNIRKAYTGSFVGKTVESKFEYGFPNTGIPDSTSNQIGESFHPTMSVFKDNSTYLSVGPVQWSAGTLPVNNLRYYLDGVSAPGVNTPIFSYGLGVGLVDRISFPNSGQVETALRADASNTWEGATVSAYTGSTLDNASIVLGKQPTSNVALGGSKAFNTWDWVRVREYAPSEPTTSVAGVESLKLSPYMSVSTGLPGALQTTYNFSVTPNMPIPDGGSLLLSFPSAYAGRLNALTGPSISVAAHAQITGTTVTIDAIARTILLDFTASAPITAPIQITIGDSNGPLGDLANPSDPGPHTIIISSRDGADAQLASGSVQMAPAGWWDTAWAHRQSMHVNNTKVNSALGSYQVNVRLNAGNFTFADAQANGEDLRFILPDGTVLPHWIEYYNSGTQQASIWVGLTNIPANTEQMMFLYYGNGAATTTSNGYNVFPYFDGFEDNDISDWFSYSYTPGVITVVGGEVKMEEQQNARAYLTQAYAPSVDGKALEASVRYVGSFQGEEYNPAIGFTGSDPTKNIVTGPVQYNAGTVPTDRLRIWYNGNRADKVGTNYTTGQNILISLATKNNYFLARSRLLENTTWDAQDYNDYDTSTLIGKVIYLGKRAFSDPSFDLGTGPTSQQFWQFIRLREYIYAEPSVALGAEENNTLPLTPTNVFLNSQTNGATTNTPTPLQLDSTSLVFSSEFQASTALLPATHFGYDIASDAGFTSIVASSGYTALTSSVANGARSEDITLNTSTLDYNTTYYLRMRFFDSSGLVSPYSATYTFAIPDLTAPSLSTITPSQGATGVALDSAVDFTLTDDFLVDISTLDVQIDGANAISAGVCQAGFTCTLGASGTNVPVQIVRTTNFTAGQTVALVISVRDAAGNVTTENRSFTTFAAASTTPSTPFLGSGGGFSATLVDLLQGSGSPTTQTEDTSTRSSTDKPIQIPTIDGNLFGKIGRAHV